MVTQRAVGVFAIVTLVTCALTLGLWWYAFQPATHTTTYERSYDLAVETPPAAVYNDATVVSADAFTLADLEAFTTLVGTPDMAVQTSVATQPAVYERDRTVIVQTEGTQHVLTVTRSFGGFLAGMGGVGLLWGLIVGLSTVVLHDVYEWAVMRLEPLRS
jgi:hypothetical protein